MKARKLPIQPLIKSQPQAVLVQSVFRHVLVSSGTEITMEFSFVGIQRGREGVVGSNRTVGGSGRKPLPLFPTRRKSAIFPPIVRLKPRKLVE
jgi:hypothetical protein